MSHRRISDEFDVVSLFFESFPAFVVLRSAPHLTPSSPSSPLKSCEHKRPCVTHDLHSSRIVRGVSLNLRILPSLEQRTAAGGGRQCALCSVFVTCAVR